MGRNRKGDDSDGEHRQDVFRYGDVGEYNSYTNR